MGVEDCIDTTKHECWMQPRQVCLTNIVTKCETNQADFCVEVPVAILRKELVEAESQTCATEPEEVCVQVDRVSCDIIPKKDCKKVTHRECSSQTKESTKLECGNVESVVCVDTPNTQCETLDAEVCIDAPVTSCQDEVRDACTSLAIETCKNRREEVDVEVCRDPEPGQEYESGPVHYYY